MDWMLECPLRPLLHNISCSKTYDHLFLDRKTATHFTFSLQNQWWNPPRNRPQMSTRNSLAPTAFICSSQPRFCSCSWSRHTRKWPRMRTWWEEEILRCCCQAQCPGQGLAVQRTGYQSLKISRLTVLWVVNLCPRHCKNTMHQTLHPTPAGPVLGDLRRSSLLWRRTSNCRQRWGQHASKHMHMLTV